MLKKSILVVDDEVSIVDILKLHFENIGYKIYKAYNGKQVLKIVEKVMPSLVILDFMLPDIHGEKICAILREKYDVPIIILSEKTSEDDILNGYNIGADDYILKPVNPRLLMAKAMALLRRTSERLTPLFKQYSFNNGELMIDTLRHQIRKNGKEIKTTPSEYKLLMTMIKYPKVFTREELIIMAFGNNYRGSNRVIDTHIKNLRQKIEADPKLPQYILTVPWTGYRFNSR